MSADTLLQRVHAVLEQHHLLRSDARVLAAVSGGPDSLCLLHVLWRIQASGGPALHVAHLDHGVRGAQSAAEAAFVAHTADAWGLPATVEYTDVGALVRASRQNKQAAARAARYAFLARVALAVGADALAVAHHADDQAETLLLHLLRGAGPAGLRGMRQRVPWHEWQQLATAEDPPAGVAPFLLRPLLHSSRAEIEHYCREQGLAPCYDPSNDSPHSTRSRIRSELLPTLAAYNPQLVAALGRTAHVCADDYAYIQAQLERIWPDLAEEQPEAVAFRGAAWQALPASLQRYALRRAAALLLGSEDDIGYEHIEAGRAAVRQGPGFQQTLAAGLCLRVEHGGFLLIQRSDTASASSAAASAALADVPQLATESLPLAVPGTTPLGAGWLVETSNTTPASPQAERLSAAGRWSVILDADKLDTPLVLRRRQAGDRFRPAGGTGSRRLQDFFIDHKVPHALRAAWPILATPNSIVWVAGLRADERFRASTHTQRRLEVMLKRENGA